MKFRFDREARRQWKDVVMNVAALLFLPLLIEIATVAHVVATRRFARSRGSHIGWLLLVIFVPFPGVLFYWLSEAPRRRSGPPAAAA